MHVLRVNANTNVKIKVVFRLQSDILARLHLLEPRAHGGEVGARGGLLGPAVADDAQHELVGVERARVRPERLLAVAPPALHALHYFCVGQTNVVSTTSFLNIEIFIIIVAKHFK